MWATLMGALDRALLPTQRSKFTQFLLFYAARQVRFPGQQPRTGAERKCFRHLVWVLICTTSGRRMLSCCSAGSGGYSGFVHACQGDAVLARSIIAGLSAPVQPCRRPLPCDLQEPEQCSREMLQLLLARLGDARAPPLTRSAAAAYAGSFLARAAFVPPPLVVSAVQVWGRGTGSCHSSSSSICGIFPVPCRQCLHHCCSCAAGTPSLNTISCWHPTTGLLRLCKAMIDWSHG